MLLLYHFISVSPTTYALVLSFLVCLIPQAKDAWKYCIFLLDGPTWSTGHTHYPVQKETLSASDSCKGSFLQTAFGQQIPNTQGSPELKDSKCIHRDSQPLFLRFLTQTDSTSSVSALSFIWCINTGALTAVLPNPAHWEFQQTTVYSHMRAANLQHLIKAKSKKQPSAVLFHNVISAVLHTNRHIRAIRMLNTPFLI